MWRLVNTDNYPSSCQTIFSLSSLRVSWREGLFKVSLYFPLSHTQFDSVFIVVVVDTTHILSILTSVHLDIATIFMTPAKWMHTQTKTQIWTHTPTLTQNNTHRCNTRTHRSTTSCTWLSDTLWRIVSQLLLSLSGTLGGPIKNLCQDVINARLGLSSYFFPVAQEAAPATFGTDYQWLCRTCYQIYFLRIMYFKE